MTPRQKITPFPLVRRHRRGGGGPLPVDLRQRAHRQRDALWRGRAGAGAPGQCGWLKDKFGLSWQVVPRALIELLQDPDPQKAGRVMQSMMTMGKIDIAALQRAHRGI